MKKIIFFLNAIIVSLAVNGQIKVTNTGNVGIGLTPSYRLNVNISGTNKTVFSSWTNAFIDQTGECGATCLYPQLSWYIQLGKPSQRIGNIWCYEVHCQSFFVESSDTRLKENILGLENSLSKLMQVNGIKYNVKESTIDNIPELKKNLYKKPQFGFSAQEIESVFPELVEIDSTGYLGIKYTRMIPVIVEAIKQQQNIIYAQSLKIKELDDKLKKIESSSDSKSALKSETNSIPYITEIVNIQSNKNTGLINNLVFSTNTFLYQNNPNPFSDKTEIKYFIDEGVKTSMLMIFDMQGVLKKQISLNSIRHGSTSIEASELHAGMYIYTLVCNGQEIDSKRMILTE